jgi:Flp pilus assembly protein TadG
MLPLFSANKARRDREAGVAMVEFALVLPVLLLVLLGILDFGKAINYWLNENHLASEGARWAVVDRNPGSGSGDTLQEYILSHADTAELRSGGTNSVSDKPLVCISFPDGTSLVGDPVRVEVAATYSWLPFLQQKWLDFLPLNDVTIRGAATMRLEAAPTQYAAGCF